MDAIDRDTSELPAHVSRVLTDFVDAARAALGGRLRSLVLFGSGAENRLRATSDVNVVAVLTAFDAASLAALRPAVLSAHAAIRLEVMWLLESEVPQAADAFAVKFTDIARRRRVLYGPDPFASLTVPREAAIARLRQVLLNLVLRLRASYALDGGHDERIAIRVAEAAGPLRVSAAELLHLERGIVVAPRDGLRRATEAWTAPGRDAVLRAISEARETRSLEPGTAAGILTGVIELATYLHRRAADLS
jgi:hypothetical protein